MYIPKSFLVEDRSAIFRLIRENGFAMLVTTDGPEPWITHLPLMLDIDEQSLIGHVAKANRHWRLFDGRPSVAVFHGPHAYVSPAWYASSPNVPTWNYQVAHAHGVPALIEDSDEVIKWLRRLVSQYDPELEVSRPDGLDDDYLRRHAAGIVAFRMPIERLEGKFKLNQNKTEADRAGVIEALSGTEHGLVAEAMSALDG